MMSIKSISFFSLCILVRHYKTVKVTIVSLSISLYIPVNIYLHNSRNSSLYCAFEYEIKSTSGIFKHGKVTNGTLKVTSTWLVCIKRTTTNYIQQQVGYVIQSFRGPFFFLSQEFFKCMCTIILVWKGK